jgi:competence protein ComGC
MSKINSKGFGHVEMLLVVIVIVLVGAVGYFVYNRSKSHSSTTTIEGVEAVRQQDPYYEMPATEQSTPAELEQINSTDPALRKSSGADSVCGADSYEIINSGGTVIGCTVGAE